MAEPARDPHALISHFLDTTLDARLLSQKCRDYHDGKQWTETEAAILAKRKQAAIVVNRVRPKVKGLVGLYEIRKSDPKAFPRTPKHEEAAHVMTDGLRYVADNTKFDRKRLKVAKDYFIEGYGGVIIDKRERRMKDGSQETEIVINTIPWDRIYFDPHSRQDDFKDASVYSAVRQLSFKDFVTRRAGIYISGFNPLLTSTTRVARHNKLGRDTCY